MVEEVGAGVAPGRGRATTSSSPWSAPAACHSCARGEPPLCETKFPARQRSPLRRPTDRRSARASAPALSPSGRGRRLPGRADPARRAAGQRLAAGLRRDHRPWRGPEHRRGPPGRPRGDDRHRRRRPQLRAGCGLLRRPDNVAVDLSDASSRPPGPSARATVNPTRRTRGVQSSSLTAGRGADYVFVAAGSAAAIEQGATLLRRGARWSSSA